MLESDVTLQVGDYLLLTLLILMVAMLLILGALLFFAFRRLRFLELSHSTNSVRKCPPVRPQLAVTCAKCRESESALCSYQLQCGHVLCKRCHDALVWSTQVAANSGTALPRCPLCATVVDRRGTFLGTVY